MTPEEVRQLIDDALEGETHREGMALYSSIAALNRPGRFYILGYNPADKGGNYNRLADERLKQSSWSAYFDQCWHLNDEEDCGCISRGKFKDFQKAAQKLIRALQDSDDDKILRDTFATNAIFVASARPADLGTAKERRALWKRHWQVHRKFLSLIQPDYIIALGYGDSDSPYALLRTELNGKSTEIRGQASEWRSFDVPRSLCDEIGKAGRCQVIGFHHPSWRTGQDKAWRDFLAHAGHT
jgi:hypothetical protein